MLNNQLGKLVNTKEKPLDLKWIKNPTRTLGIYVSYDSQGNNKLNFETKIPKFQIGIPTASTTLCKKINYTIMFLRYYIYKRKLQNDSLLLPYFINKIVYKYIIKKLLS